MDDSGQHSICGFDDQGQILLRVALPSRGHAVAVSPDGNHAVAVARRPERYFMVIDLNSGEILHHLQSQPNRHFYGHGVYSADRRWFYTTENDLILGQGVIGVRDVARDYEWVREFPSHGIGPHELKLLSDGDTLVVANGGILTRPETGRAKLNLDRMQPSLAYLNRHSGELLEQHTLPAALRQNSIRHLAVSPDDQVCCVMQYQGNRTDTPPLIGLHRRGNSIQLLIAPNEIQQRMHNYCGSACVDQAGKVFAVSSPKGNLITFWHGGNGAFLGHVDLADGCGIAASTTPGEFILSSGQGAVLRYRTTDQHRQIMGQPQHNHVRWDNHLTRI